MLTKQRILKDFDKIFKRFPFKTKIIVRKIGNYGNFFNIGENGSMNELEVEAIINNPQPGNVVDREYRTDNNEYSLFVKGDVNISYDDEIEWNGKKFAITYIGGAVDENNERLWYEIRMKLKG